MEQFIVICHQIVGGDYGQPFTTVYEWDGDYFEAREQAISHGFVTRGSDDFNIATIERDCLTGFYWMDNDMSDPDEMREIAKQLGLKTRRATKTRGIK